MLLCSCLVGTKGWLHAASAGAALFEQGAALAVPLPIQCVQEHFAGVCTRRHGTRCAALHSCCTLGSMCSRDSCCCGSAFHGEFAAGALFCGSTHSKDGGLIWWRRRRWRGDRKAVGNAEADVFEDHAASSDVGDQDAVLRRHSVMGMGRKSGA